MISVDIQHRLNAYNGSQKLQVKTEFAPGSITKIFGPSGVGKTTFLKIIAGFIKPGRGRIIVNETVWLDTVSGIFIPPQKRMAGFVFQDYALFPNMTVREHLEYATGDDAWITRLLTLGELEPFARHKPAHLSGGQQQRLAILRAMANKPKLLLMDEPFSALDQEMRYGLIAELRFLFLELGTTVLIVSHYPQELEGLTDLELQFASE